VKAPRVLLRFLVASTTAFGALHYFGFTYESLLLSIADHFIGGLDLGARLLHDASHQLCIIIFLPGGPAQFKIAGLDWIYAGQAAAVGGVLSAYAPAGRKAFWMAIVVAMMALTHTALLVLATAEICRQINGTNGALAAFGAIVLELYRIAIPFLLASVWILCSREALAAFGIAGYVAPLREPEKRATGSRTPQIPQGCVHRHQSGLPTPAARRGPHAKRFRSPAIPQSSF